MTTLFHPNVFQWHPEVTVYEQWKDAFDHAQELGIWITHVDDVVALGRERDGSTMTSTWKRGVLSVQVDAQRDGLTLALPTSTAEREISVVTVDDVRTPFARVTDVGGDLALVTLSMGEHAISVEYSRRSAVR